MKTKVLVALDGSDHSMKSVRYIATLFQDRDDISITLFHVSLALPPVVLEYSLLTDTERLSREKWRQSQEEFSRELFDRAKELLQRAGIPDEMVSAKRSSPQYDSKVARAILEEVKNGDYDTVVLGKHGRSKIQEFLIGSVAERIIRHAEGCVVWVVE